MLPSIISSAAMVSLELGIGGALAIGRVRAALASPTRT
jgi:hypothetical protein